MGFSTGTFNKELRLVRRAEACAVMAIIRRIIVKTSAVGRRLRRRTSRKEPLEALKVRGCSVT